MNIVPLAWPDDKSVPLFQDVARDHSPRGEDICSVSAVSSPSRGILRKRSIEISHETVRAWWNRFGPMFAAEIRQRRSATMRGFTQWRWHLDEVFVRINGELHYIWRAVEHEGEVFETYVSKRRDRRAALNFMKRAIKRFGRPRSVVADHLRSYGAAMREIGNAARQITGRKLNNRVENSHQPFRRRERAMAKSRTAKSLQKFVAIHASVHNHFNQEHYLRNRENFKRDRSTALAEWRQ